MGLNVQVRPAGETVCVRATVPVKPFTGATVIVEVQVAPARHVTLVGLSVTVKSVTMKVVVAQWVIEPLVPHSVTVKVPAEPEQESVDV